MKAENAHAIRLPWPPSANRLWRNFGGKVLKSAHYRAWQREVALDHAGEALHDVAALERLGLEHLAAFFERSAR